MYATVRSYADTGLADTLAAHADEIRSVISGVPGFRAYYLIKTGDGTVSVTVCDDEAGAEASNRTAADWLRTNLPDLQGAAPAVASGQVLIGT